MRRLSIACVVTLALGALLHGQARAVPQWISFTNSLSGNPINVTSPGGVSSLLPSGGVVQHLSINIPNGALSAQQSYTVVDSSLVDVHFNGFNGNASSATCLDLEGYNCNAAWITTTVINSVTLRVIANRQSTGNNATAVNVSFDVMDVNASLVDAIYRGTLSSGTPFTFTACAGGTTKTGLTWLGIAGGNLAGLNTLTSATTVTATNGSAVTQAAQIICWH